MVKDLNELSAILHREWGKLDEVSCYLNDAGNGRKDALRAMIWHISFYDTIAEFITSEGFLDLFEIRHQHEEYYKTLRRFKSVLEKSIETE